MCGIFVFIEDNYNFDEKRRPSAELFNHRRRAG
jgi:hypothetical protein